MAESFKLALIQMHVEGGARSANLRRASTLVTEAQRGGAKVVLLPETLDLGWTCPASRAQGEPVPGGVTARFLQELAREHRVFLCAGLTERAGNKIYNAALLISPDGQVLVHHRKINELTLAHDCYDLGDRMQVAETGLGTFGVMICADAFASGQVIARTLARMGADVILSPCAWAVPADHDPVREPYGQLWRDHYMPVAREHRVWIAGASNVGWIRGGPWDGRKCIGCSLVVDADGREVLMGPYGVDAEAVLFVDVVPEPRPARGTGWESWWEKTP